VGSKKTGKKAAKKAAPKKAAPKKAAPKKAAPKKAAPKKPAAAAAYRAPAARPRRREAGNRYLALLAAWETKLARESLSLVRAARTYAGAMRHIGPLLRRVQAASAAAVEARATYEQNAANPLPADTAFWRKLRDDARLRVERAESSAKEAQSLLTLAYRRVEWIARRQAFNELRASLSTILLGRLGVLSDWIDTAAKGPGRGEIQATYDPTRWRDAPDPTDILFRIGDAARTIFARYPSLRSDLPDGGLLGRVRFEVRMARYSEANEAGRELIDSILARLQDSYGVGFRAEPGYQRERRRLRKGRFVPNWYDVRNIDPATLRAMGRIDQLKGRGIAVKAIVLQVVLGNFRTKALNVASRKRYEALAASGLVFGRGARKP
jgi:hypothetical protein